jgi:hypothetical protein
MNCTKCGLEFRTLSGTFHNCKPPTVSSKDSIIIDSAKDEYILEVNKNRALAILRLEDKETQDLIKAIAKAVNRKEDDCEIALKLLYEAVYCKEERFVNWLDIRDLCIKVLDK